MSSKQILVAGATGIVGQAAIAHFSSRPGWDVIGLSRRPLRADAKTLHVAADLRDPAGLRAALAAHEGVTHVLYAALYEKPDLVAGWQDDEQMEVNATMLRNLLDALHPVARRLEHVTLLQGTKAYGLHATQVPVPAKERWPRAPHPVFYWQQEDLLRERAARAGWRWSVLRPQLILGHAAGSPMNVIAAIGVYAAVMRELGEPLHFPGGGRYVHAASDSRLIAQAAEFAGTHTAAANETYNVVNGDTMVWQDLWPAIARQFGMAVGEPRPLRLTDAMPQHEAVWARIVARHGLQDGTMQRLLNSSWQFTDRTFGFGLERPLDRLVSPIKLRQAGFDACLDTEDAFTHWLDRLQQARVLPH